MWPCAGMQDGEESDLGAEMPYTLNERQEAVPFFARRS